MLSDAATATRMLRTHECARCGGELVDPWDAQGNAYNLKCGTCGNAEQFKKRASLAERWRRDPGSVPVAIANRMEKKYGGEPMNSQALARIDEPTMIERMEKARWMTDVQKTDRPLLAALAVRYGLDPVMGELIIYEGKPYVTFNGWLRKMQEHPDFAGIEDRPMTAEEREAYGYAAPVCWIARVYKKGWQVPATGTGTADPNQPYRNNPVERKFPQAFARKRAIIQAGKVGFLHSLPFAREESAEEAGITVDVRSGTVTGPSPMDAEIAEVDEAEYREQLETPPAPTTPADLFPDPDEPDGFDEALDNAELAEAARQRVEALIKKQGRTLATVQQWVADTWALSWEKMTTGDWERLEQALTPKTAPKASAKKGQAA